MQPIDVSREQITALRDRGLNLTEIGIHLDLNLKQVSRLITKFSLAKKASGGKGKTSDWLKTPEDEAKFRRLWDEGLSSSTIATHFSFGTTKNMVLGAAHRRKFPSRESPIKCSDGRTTSATISRDKRFTVGPRKTLPPLVSDLPLFFDAPQSEGVGCFPPATHVVPSAPLSVGTTFNPLAELEALALAYVTPKGVPDAPWGSCQYPTTSRQPWYFCGHKAEVGKPYCAQHRLICWVAVSRPNLFVPGGIHRAPERIEDAAVAA